MIMIGDILISEELLEEHFVCDLNACKGACCVEGDAGAPLLKEETAILDEIFSTVAPYLPEKGLRTIKKKGKWVEDPHFGDFETPIIQGKECVYTVFENGVATCGIEKAWADGKISFRKPISCQLYPIRVVNLGHGVEALNYHRWDICDPACALGSQLKVPVYRFLKDSLVRRYGQAFYEELDAIAVARKG
ncbi:MAG: DUF3109 family protein [Bacteroidia bacterium]|nr:DUF3109 family protein [Bacteroidia bacterium]